jgi:hypothetical protein
MSSSAIETELLTATKLSPGKNEPRAKYLFRLWDAAYSLPLPKWNKLSAPAAEWANEVTLQHTEWRKSAPNGEFLPNDFPDLDTMDPAEAAQAARRSKAKPLAEDEDEDEDEAEEELPKAKKPKAPPAAVEEPKEEPEEEPAEEETPPKRPDPEDEPEEEDFGTDEEEPEDEPEEVEEAEEKAPAKAAKPAKKPVEKPAKAKEPEPEPEPEPVKTKSKTTKEPTKESTKSTDSYDEPRMNVQGMVRTMMIKDPKIELNVLHGKVSEEAGTAVSLTTVRASYSWFRAALRDLDRHDCLSKAFKAKVQSSLTKGRP